MENYPIMLQLASGIIVGSFAGYTISMIVELIVYLVRNHKEKKEDSENE